VFQERFLLVPADDTDGDRLHDLFCLPDVYRYLADGIPPAREITSRWIEKSHMDRLRTPDVGLFLLMLDGERIAGCARTLFLDAPRTAELTYVLHPEQWGQGLATSMGWTVMQRAFDSGYFETMIAGTDDPNTASVAVMRRLGMRFLRRTRNPRWTGVEYVRGHDDPLPEPVPERLRFST